MNIHKTTTVIITQVSSFKQWVYEITLQNNIIIKFSSAYTLYTNCNTHLEFLHFFLYNDVSVKNIYEKLDVPNRRQAIKTARELHILRN